MTSALRQECDALYDACLWDEASAALERLLRATPNDASAWYRLGNVRLEQGRDPEALEHFAQAIACDPTHAQAMNNLGSACERMGRLQEALQAYRRAAETNPKLFEPYLNLGRLCESQGDLAAAARHLSAGLAQHPDHPMLVHLLAAASGQNTVQAPREHVVAYFDGFAPYFDQHLVGQLKYRVPEMLAALLRPRLRGPACVADLGCGTGLVGAALSESGVELVGIDLSPRMLDLARARGVYKELILADAAEALARLPAGSLAAAVAADVLIYIGDLEGLFAATTRVLASGGKFAFSIETLDQGTYRLRSSGRYAHSLAYVRELAGRHGLRELEAHPCRLREDSQGQANGHLLLLERL